MAHKGLLEKTCDIWEILPWERQKLSSFGSSCPARNFLCIFAFLVGTPQQPRCAKQQRQILWERNATIQLSWPLIQTKKSLPTGTLNWCFTELNPVINGENIGVISISQASINVGCFPSQTEKFILSVKLSGHSADGTLQDASSLEFVFFGQCGNCGIHHLFRYGQFSH